MKDTPIKEISRNLGITEKQVKAVEELLNDGSTIPFIARYRKEKTGSLDEVVITEIRDFLKRHEELVKRKDAILKSLEKAGTLSEKLKGKIDLAEDLQTLEDIYLPHRPKRKTRATIARDKGLTPLAEKIMAQDNEDAEKSARPYISKEKGVASVDEALAGAADIIAEAVSEHSVARSRARDLFRRKATIQSGKARGADLTHSKFKDYESWEEPAKNAPSHRVLAMFRGSSEGFLTISAAPPEQEALYLLEKIFVRGKSQKSTIVKKAVEDGYKRLLSKSLETEIMTALKEKADTEAISVFSGNLRQLLLLPPLGPKRVLALDPGFRTGCKLACLDPQGNLVHHTTIYPHTPGKEKEAETKLTGLLKKYRIEAVAIGNGTAGRETEAFVKDVAPGDIIVTLVNESGASIYSASEAAREEFPDLDLTIRGAVSIGRRLMDPLAELVKIDPKSIGVGQYQHDVNQTRLKEALGDVVESCVNGVGVDLNSASRELLTYVSGIGPVLADNIVTYRKENGAFSSRTELKKVPRLGPKAFEQSAGFLRITGGKQVLDATAVHPESYPIVKLMAKDLGTTTQKLISSPEIRKKINPSRYVTEDTGLPTLTDIMEELEKPGRDPRDDFQSVSFKKGVNKPEDLELEMTLPGVITNITAFGAFVDIGVHQDGLLHISEMADHFVKDPASVVKLGQAVQVRVIGVDLKRKRISLSMKKKSI